MNKTCFNMVKKWSEKTNKELSLLGYIKDCENGYPKGTKLKKSLLKARAKGAYKYSLEMNLNLPQCKEAFSYLGMINEN